MDLNPNDGNYWFADFDPDGPLADAKWRPYLQMVGMVCPVEMWFSSEADCLGFIRREIIGVDRVES